MQLLKRQSRVRIEQWLRKLAEKARHSPIFHPHAHFALLIPLPSTLFLLAYLSSPFLALHGQAAQPQQLLPYADDQPGVEEESQSARAAAARAAALRPAGGPVHAHAARRPVAHAHVLGAERFQPVPVRPA